MKIALVHDHLTQHGGAENVLLVFQEIWPEAPTFTLVYNPETAHPSFQDRDIRTSWLQRMPFASQRYQWYLPLMATATESYDLREYDVVISSASALAKGIITQPHTVHICYCHTPTRYLWTDTHSYVRELRYPRLVKAFIPRLLTQLRMWDRLAAERVDSFIANSHVIKRRIEKYYRRSAEVIYPPVDLSSLAPSAAGAAISKHPFFSGNDQDSFNGFFLVGGRLVYYKRFDIAIRAFNKLGMRLKVFGDGPEFVNLKNMAKQNIEFLGKVSESEKIRLMQSCTAFLYPHEEDFGITAIEAMACGRPVVAFRAGGATETIVEGKTGVFFDDQDWEALADTIIRTDFTAFQPDVIHKHARRFSKERFKEQMRAFVEQEWERLRK